MGNTIEKSEAIDHADHLYLKTELINKPNELYGVGEETDTLYLRATPAREAAEDFLESLQSIAKQGYMEFPDLTREDIIAIADGALTRANSHT